MTARGLISILIWFWASVSIAQLPVIPLQVFTSAAAVIPGPTNISSRMFRWWVSRDVAAGVTLSNQWVDRIVGDPMWQMNTSVSPTNSVIGAYFKRASSQFLTNSAGVGGYDVGNITGRGSNDTFYFVIRPNGTAGFNIVFCPLNDTQGPDMVASVLHYGGNISGDYTVCTLAANTTNDVVATFGITKTTWYTNGVPCITNTTTSVDDFAYTRMGGRSSLGFYDGYISENGIYTDLLFSASQVVDLHKYLTNYWGQYGP